MVKTILYTVTYNDAKYVKDWIKYYDDVDYFFIVDLGSTDNTIDLLSEDPRVISRIPGFSSSTPALDYALNEIGKIVERFSEDQWLLLSLGIDETPEENLIQKIKEKYQENPFYQLSLRNQYKNSVIRCCTIEGKSNWSYVKNSYTLKKGNISVLQTNLSFTQRESDIVTEVKKKAFDFLSEGDLSLEEIPFIQKTLLFCKNEKSYTLYNSLLSKILSLYPSARSRVFGAKRAFQLWTVYLILFSIGTILYPEDAHTSFFNLYLEMKSFYKEFKDSCFLFKKIPYDLAKSFYLKQDLSEKGKNECLEFLSEAKLIFSNNSISDFYIDLPNDNIVIQELEDQIRENKN